LLEVGECCLKWKLRKGQVWAAGLLVAVAASVLFPKLKELVKSVVNLLLAMYSNPSLVESLEESVALEEQLVELRWQEWRVHSLCLDPEVEVLVLWSNCTGIQERYLLLQSRICRYPRFRKWSTVVAL
jgi:hypothetical protein